MNEKRFLSKEERLAAENFTAPVVAGKIIPQEFKESFPITDAPVSEDQSINDSEPILDAENYNQDFTQLDGSSQKTEVFNATTEIPATPEAIEPPKSEQRPIPESIQLKNLPLNWQSLRELHGSINNLKENPVNWSEISNLKPPESAAPALISIASVINQKRHPEVPVTTLTNEQIKEIKPWLKTVRGVIGRFSEKTARSFDQYLENKVGQLTTEFGSRVLKLAEVLEQTEYPRQQLLAELAFIYNKLTTSDEDAFMEDTAEVKIYNLLRDLSRIRDDKRFSQRYVTAKECPLLTKLLPVLRLPGRTSGTEDAAGSEILQGIEAFLRQQGVQNVNEAPEPGEIEVMNPFSWIDPFRWTRLGAEVFASEKLEQVRTSLPVILAQALATLPNYGPSLANGIYAAAEGIMNLKKQGNTNKEVVDVLFASGSITK